MASSPLSKIPIKRRRRKGRLVQVEPSTLIEKIYLKELRRILKRVSSMVAKKIAPSVERLTADVWDHRSRPVRLDLIADRDETISRTIAGIRVDIGKLTTRKQVERLLRDLFGKINKSNISGTRRQMKQLIGIDLFADPSLSALLSDVITENVALIESLSDQYLDEVETIVSEGVRAGQRAETIQRGLIERLGVAESRAKLIARDQVAKINAGITKARQTDLGIEEYIWRTSKDERVRETHQDLEGKTFRWDKPPPEGHPGGPINCRCTAEPVLPEL